MICNPILTKQTARNSCPVIPRLALLPQIFRVQERQTETHPPTGRTLLHRDRDYRRLAAACDLMPTRICNWFLILSPLAHDSLASSIGRRCCEISSRTSEFPKRQPVKEYAFCRFMGLSNVTLIDGEVIESSGDLLPPIGLTLRSASHLTHWMIRSSIIWHSLYRIIIHR
jgi:hypothetical protein